MDPKTKYKLVALAMEEAQRAANDGNYPFGAVIADALGNIIATAHNTQNSDCDPTAHAETNLIRKLARQYSQAEFGYFYLASNAESCSMCMSAAIKAGITHYIFGAPSEPHMEPYLTVSDMVKFCRVQLDISFGVMAAECQQQIARIREEQGDLAQ